MFPATSSTVEMPNIERRKYLTRRLRLYSANTKYHTSSLANFHRDPKDGRRTPHQLDRLHAQYRLLTDKNLKQECIRAALRREGPHQE